MNLGVTALKAGLDDQDNDGIPDSLDNCPSISNADQADLDLNGVGDVCEQEDDWLLMLLPAIISAGQGDD